MAENAKRKARRRRRVGYPASLRNAVIGVFGGNPKGTGALSRHSLLLSSPRPPVLASSAAAIGGSGHPFAFATIALTGPRRVGRECPCPGSRRAPVPRRGH